MGVRVPPAPSSGFGVPHAPGCGYIAAFAGRTFVPFAAYRHGLPWWIAAWRLIGGAGAALDMPRNPDPRHQASLNATTVVPVAPPDSAVSPQGRLSGRIGAYGRVWGPIVHKPLP